jgi:hypothetical protein
MSLTRRPGIRPQKRTETLSGLGTRGGSGRLRQNPPRRTYARPTGGFSPASPAGGSLGKKNRRFDAQHRPPDPVEVDGVVIREMLDNRHLPRDSPPVWAVGVVPSICIQLPERALDGLPADFAEHQCVRELKPRKICFPKVRVLFGLSCMPRKSVSKIARLADIDGGPHPSFFPRLHRHRNRRPIAARLPHWPVNIRRSVSN